jgi:hypothetical protein
MSTRCSECNEILPPTEQEANWCEACMENDGGFNYEQSQFDRLAYSINDSPKIKIIWGDSSTNWMNITAFQLEAIKEILN